MVSIDDDIDSRRSSSEAPLQEIPSEDYALGDFATKYNLEHKLDILQKASLLLRDEDPDQLDLTDSERILLAREQSHKWQQPRLLYFTIAVCSLGAVEQGWAQTSMNGANLTFPSALNVGTDSARDVFIVGLINSALYLSIALWGAWLSDPLNRRFGRRGAIFLGTSLCLVANIGSAVSGHWTILLFFRLLLGTGLGINASTVSVFAAECAPARIRGGLAVSWQMWVAFGVFIGFVANVAVYNYGPDQWRLQLAGPIIPALFVLVTVYACPESPAWYVKNERYDRAYQSFQRLRNTEILAAKEVVSSYFQRRSASSSLLTLFSSPRIRHATIAACVTQLAQQLCGINIIAFYSSTIFSDAGFSQYYALLASCVFGFVNFIGAFPAIWTMDTLGRRSLLLWTLPFMALTMFGTGLTFQLPQGNMQFAMLAALIYLFCAEYSPGMGPVPCAYSAEVFPLSHREIGMSLAIATTMMWAAILSVTFPGLLAGLGAERTFELYGLLNVVALGLVFVCVRETKEKTLEELDEVFAGGMKDFALSAYEEQRSWWRNRWSKSQPYMELTQDETPAD